MKNKLLPLLLFISILFSCSSNIDSNNLITTADLTGTWNLTNFAMNNVEMRITDPGSVTIFGSAIGKNYNASITFSENPNQAAVEGNFVLQLTYEYGQTITEDLFIDNILFNDTFGFETSSFTVVNDVITLTESGQTLSINVISFTDNKISIETEINQTVTMNNITSTVLGTAILTLEK